MFRLIPPVCLALFLASAAVPDTGYVARFGAPSGGHVVTFHDGASGFAYWCIGLNTCLHRARTACAHHFVLRAIADIDRAQSPDTERRDATNRNFWQNAHPPLHAIAVSCLA